MDEDKEKKDLKDELLKTKEELDKLYRDLGRIYDIVNTIHSTLRLSELASISKTIIEQTLGLDTYSLIVYDSVTKQFVVVETSNLSKDIEEKALQSVRDFADEWHRKHKASVEPEKTKITSDAGDSITRIPIAVYKRTVGALFISDEILDKVNHEGNEILTLITNQLTVAMENSILYEITRKLSITDDKTGIYNLRYLKQRLALELRRAHRYERPLSFLMIDIDDFKRYNDTYGHIAGDVVIKEIADVIRGLCRQIDMVARYGGEEFCVMLPETDGAGAEMVAKRLIDLVAEYEFKGKAEDDVERLSVSVGVASYPEHADSASQLIELSDQALLIAKKNGKNQFQVVTKGKGSVN